MEGKAHTGPAVDLPFVELSELPKPADAKSEMAQIYKKLQSWYKTNKARKMLPKSRCVGGEKNLLSLFVHL